LYSSRWPEMSRSSATRWAAVGCRRNRFARQRSAVAPRYPASVTVEWDRRELFSYGALLPAEAARFGGVPQQRESACRAQPPFRQGDRVEGGIAREHRPAPPALA
jgi:hypothetical protein